MRWEEVREIAPEFTRVEGRGTLGGPVEWRVRPSHHTKLLPYVGAPNSLKLELWGGAYGVLERVRIRYPSVVAAKAALTAAWGPQTADGWHDREHLTRADVHEDGDVFLGAYQPRDELLADGLELSWGGRHLLDADREELAEHVFYSPQTCLIGAGTGTLLPTENDFFELHFDANGHGRLNGYSLLIAMPLDVLERTLTEHFGPAVERPRAECHYAPSVSSYCYDEGKCRVFPDRNGVAAEGCIGMTVDGATAPVSVITIVRAGAQP